MAGFGCDAHRCWRVLELGCARERVRVCVFLGTDAARLWGFWHAGRFTFFGKAADLLNQVVTQGRFQKIVIKITLWLLAFSILLVVIIFVRALRASPVRWCDVCCDARAAFPTQIKLMVSSDTVVAIESSYKKRSKLLQAISTCVVLLVASIPIAIEVVCTTTMAMGSRRLAEKKVIVARLSAIEELAGMTILCSDKTGTLTQNKLSLNEPVLFADMTSDELVFYAALCSKRGGGQDAIDFCMTQSLTPEYKWVAGCPHGRRWEECFPHSAWLCVSVCLQEPNGCVQGDGLCAVQPHGQANGVHCATPRRPHVQVHQGRAADHLEHDAQL